jgi:RNA polymerase sigma-70 factor (ECF subfamily)
MADNSGIADRLREHVAGLRRYALVLTRDRDRAEDLVQDCLAKAIAAADTWQPGTDLRVWLFRILHNTHVSELRKQRVRREAAPEIPDPVVEADATKRVELQQVLDALDRLPEDQRRAIVLVALEGMSYADAAKALGVPPGTLYSRLGRGREALRRAMNGARDDQPTATTSRKPAPDLRLVV